MSHTAATTVASSYSTYSAEHLELWCIDGQTHEWVTTLTRTGTWKHVNIDGHIGNFAWRSAEQAPIPNHPRGPPRKPKQSGHALWVGNLPSSATVVDLKDHFSRDAMEDIESLFLISKSNCAFVNYRTDAACVAAITRFHESYLFGVRLVCRLRRGQPSDTTDSSMLAPPVSSPAAARFRTPVDEPTIVGSGQAAPQSHVDVEPFSGTGAVNESGDRIPQKVFIIKSLTVQDLEASVRNGTWATQSHNEEALNRAYRAVDNVYLVFSANKSGEYFGYAKMTSGIPGKPVSRSSTVPTERPSAVRAPNATPTPPTETAPKGRIIDDSARGTIFWEAEPLHVDVGNESMTRDIGDDEMSQAGGREFCIEWIETSRLPFHRTRGLRNPWNANREVKIARDGTELETDVGKRLIQMFHEPPPCYAGGPPY